MASGPVGVHPPESLAHQTSSPAPFGRAILRRCRTHAVVRPGGRRTRAGKNGVSPRMGLANLLVALLGHLDVVDGVKFAGVGPPAWIPAKRGRWASSPLCP